MVNQTSHTINMAQGLIGRRHEGLNLLKTQEQEIENVVCQKCIKIFVHLDFGLNTLFSGTLYSIK
jgi:hypothetical protein